MPSRNNADDDGVKPDCTLACFDAQGSTEPFICYACDYPMCKAHMHLLRCAGGGTYWCGDAACEAIIRLDQMNPLRDRMHP